MQTGLSTRSLQIACAEPHVAQSVGNVSTTSSRLAMKVAVNTGLKDGQSLVSQTSKAGRAALASALSPSLPILSQSACREFNRQDLERACARPCARRRPSVTCKGVPPAFSWKPAPCNPHRRLLRNLDADSSIDTSHCAWTVSRMQPKLNAPPIEMPLRMRNQAGARTIKGYALKSLIDFKALGHRHDALVADSEATCRQRAQSRTCGAGTEPPSAQAKRIVCR
eukprot:6200523-Pleurochrysis_carterae.AAC.2